MVVIFLSVGDNIHVIQVPDPGGEGEMGGFHNVPDDEEHLGEGRVELYAPDYDAEEPSVPAADGGNTAASSQHTDSQASDGTQATSTQPMATPSRPIASSSAVRITTSRSISDGADSGFGKCEVSCDDVDSLKEKTSPPIHWTFFSKFYRSLRILGLFEQCFAAKENFVKLWRSQY